MRVYAQDEVTTGYPYEEYNLWRGRWCLQGAYKTKAGAIRQAKQDAEYTHEVNEAQRRPEEDRSEVFIIVDSRNGEIVGGRMILDSEKEVM